MGGSSLIFLFFNIFIFTLLFWILIFLTKYFFFKSNSRSKNIFYECGFKAYETLDLKITTNILIIAILLILYDVEFLLIISIFINVHLYSIFLIFISISLLFLVSFLLYIDNIFFFVYWPN